MEATTLESSCSAEDFLRAADVWLERPQVLNKRIFGAVLSRGSVREGEPFTRQLLPRGRQPATEELVEIDSGRVSVRLSSASGSYLLEWQQGTSEDTTHTSRVLLRISEGWHGDGVTMPTANWLSAVLLPKIVHWAENDSGHLTLSKPRELVPLAQFHQLYSLLKDKYGPALVKSWPEATDPYKFVYEDISIAAYLLVLWEQEREELGLQHRQSFIDLGCGNGLLVYLLSAEGHTGKGVDLRRRKIWKLFGDKAVLEECVLTPSDQTLFPGSDWLLGNHSDELTPWIPVMAARSSYTARYFVLPCCPHDFEGKYCRSEPHTSQYRSYLNYVRVIGQEMGFTVDEDVLRIPSSKRVCQLGRGRTYRQAEEKVFDLQRQAFLLQRCVTLTPERWACGFQPRAVNEHVRNCSRVNLSTVSMVVSTVTGKLLESERWMCVCGRQWNRGGKLSLCQVVGLFEARLLHELKQEFGGMQTLLRNQHQVFSVCGGAVELRDWASQEEPKLCAPRRQQQTDSLTKTKLCWFHDSHPQGCPRHTSSCSYAHGASELRPRPDFKNSSSFSTDLPA